MTESFLKFKDELQIAISSSPILYISHTDEQLVEMALVAALKHWNLTENVISEFFCGIGEVEFDSKKMDTDSWYKDGNQTQRLIEYLEAIVYREYVSGDGQNKRVFIIRDIQSYMGAFLGADGGSQVTPENVQLFSLLQIHAGKYYKENRDNDNIYTILLLDTIGNNRIPEPLEKVTTSLILLPPSPEEIKEAVRAYDRNHTEPGNCLFEEENCETLCRTLQGLELQEVKRILRTITCDDGGILSLSCIPQALEEKRRVVKREGILEVIEANESFNDIGGLEVLKSDLKRKSIIFKNIDRAIKDGIKIPKGIMIVGVPGCGKSMMAKAISNEFGRIPLLRLDMNRILGQYVGQSEQNMKKALVSAESASPCVLWIDEIEKAFSGASGNSNESKNDTVLRMMGFFLTWMQEKEAPVYVVATANDVMRSELMRKGRFDEVYFVDFPAKAERKAIMKKKIKKLTELSCGSIRFDVTDLMNRIDNDTDDVTKGFSGAELQYLVESLAEKAYVDYLNELSDKCDLMNLSNASLVLKGHDYINMAMEMINHRTSKQMIDNIDNNSDIKRFLMYSLDLKNAGAEDGIVRTELNKKYNNMGK